MSLEKFDIETVKLHLRIDGSDHDLLLVSLMDAAVDFCETFIGCKLEDFESLPGTILAGLLLHTSLLFEDVDGYLHKQNLQAVRLLYWPYRRLEL
jgi:hypothetical protein